MQELRPAPPTEIEPAFQPDSQVTCLFSKDREVLSQGPPYDFIFHLILIVYLSILFLAGLGLHCCIQAFSSCGMWVPHCGGFSCCRAQAVGSEASVVPAPILYSRGSVFMVHRLSCPVACGIFLDQGLNLGFLHWQMNSKPLDHQGSFYIPSFFKKTAHFMEGFEGLYGERRPRLSSLHVLLKFQRISACLKITESKTTNVLRVCSLSCV